MKKFEEHFIDKNIARLAMDYDRIKGANTNLARITPDYIDGLKPVHRRALYIMFLKDQGKKHRKLATISGDTFGRVHPHSPTSIDDALVGLAQTWANNIPLVDGEGNWGSVSGDPAGASRYIKARLSEYAFDCFFKDWKDSVIDMALGYDEETEEPLYLPAKYPNVLLNGSLGIGYGMASNIPPFNFKEVVNACMKLMSNPDSQIMLIPDSPTGADIIETDFQKICNNGSGSYSMRCKYEIHDESNTIIIKSVPYQVPVNSIRERIADIKEKSGLPELVSMNDHSGKEVDLRLTIRSDINPYKFMKKLIKSVAGIEKSYSVNITVTNDYQSFDYSIKELLLEWIRYRREQKRIVVNHKRTTLLGEQRTNDVKLFLMHKNNLDDTIAIFRNGQNRTDIESKLIEKYRDSAIRMDSLQAQALSNMRMHELSKDSYTKYKERRDVILDELVKIEAILNDDDGIDKLIIGELKEGIKKYGRNRMSNVVPISISTSTDIDGVCILQLLSNGILHRTVATNVDEPAIPKDSNGFAIRVENDNAFIAVDEEARFAFIKVSDVPVGVEVPLNRFLTSRLGKIVGFVPFDIESKKACVIITSYGNMKRVKISDISPSKRSCIDLPEGDKIVKVIVCDINSDKDILVFTEEGMGQRIVPNNIKMTSISAKGSRGFNLIKGDNIIGCYLIDPDENQYILYITQRGKTRLNLIKYLPPRLSKHDKMVRLITLTDRDHLFSVMGCNKYDAVNIWFSDSSSELLKVETLDESTMSSLPTRSISKDTVGKKVVKVKVM